MKPMPASLSVKVGDFVRWQINGIDFSGHALQVTRDTVRAKSNGSIQEVNRTLLLQALPCCAHCKKPMVDKYRNEKQYCSPECWQDSRPKYNCIDCGKPCRYGAERCRKHADEKIRADTDQKVFAALVEYKRTHDGNTPETSVLMNVVFFCKNTVNGSLRRLEKAGKIQIIGEGSNRRIIVIGGKWTYGEP